MILLLTSSCDTVKVRITLLLFWTPSLGSGPLGTQARPSRWAREPCPRRRYARQLRPWPLLRLLLPPSSPRSGHTGPSLPLYVPDTSLPQGPCAACPLRLLFSQIPAWLTLSPASGFRRHLRSVAFPDRSVWVCLIPQHSLSPVRVLFFCSRASHLPLFCAWYWLTWSIACIPHWAPLGRSVSVLFTVAQLVPCT